jgi:L-xylulokinase
MDTYILAIDRGSTNLKLVLFNQKGEQAHLVSVPNQDVIADQPGWREFDLDIVWQQLCALTKQVVGGFCRPEQIAAISFSGHGNGLILLDEDRRPNGKGIYSLDDRAGSIVDRWQHDGRHAEAQEVLRCPIMVGGPLPLFAWIKENQPERAGKARHCFFVKDWLRLCLGGDIATDYTDASGGSLLDHARQCFPQGIFDRLGVPELFDMLPPLRSSTEQAGVVSEQAANSTGLVAGTPLFMGGQDVSLGAAGVGDLSEEILVSVFGSWSVSALNVVNTAGLPLVINHPIDGHFLSGVGDGNAGIALDTMIRLCFADVANDCAKSGGSVHQALEQQVLSTDKTSLLFVPHLFGSMLNPSAVAGLVGLRAHTQRGEIYKAVCEGILIGYLVNISLLPPFAGVSTVWLIGGGAKSDLLGQMMADIFGREVLVPADTEITARGAAVCAMIGQPDSDPPFGIPVPRVRRKFTPDATMAGYYAKKSALISKVLLEGDPLLEAAACL